MTAKYESRTWCCLSVFDACLMTGIECADTDDQCYETECDIFFHGQIFSQQAYLPGAVNPWWRSDLVIWVEAIFELVGG